MPGVGIPRLPWYYYIFFPDFRPFSSFYSTDLKVWLLFVWFKMVDRMSAITSALQIPTQRKIQRRNRQRSHANSLWRFPEKATYILRTSFWKNNIYKVTPCSKGVWICSIFPECQCWEKSRVL